jgi:lambda repressor-like predicted transcriptional regulator
MRLYLNWRIRVKHLESIQRSASVRRMAPTSFVQPVRHASRLTDADVTQLADSYRSGTSAKVLATRFGMHRHTVAEVLRRAGVERRTRGLTSAQVAHASRLYRDGWSLAKLGDDLGVTANTVRRYLLLAGVVMRPPNERPARQPCSQ